MKRLGIVRREAAGFWSFTRNDAALHDVMHKSTFHRGVDFEIFRVALNDPVTISKTRKDRS